jgi:hypothetical protein
MRTFGPGLVSLRIPGINQHFRPDQVTYHPPQPEHKGSAPMDVLIRSGYYQVDQAVGGIHTVPAHLVYFTSK